MRRGGASPQRRGGRKLSGVGLGGVGRVQGGAAKEIVRRLCARGGAGRGGQASRSRGGSGLPILAAHMMAGLGGMEQGGAARGPERAGLERAGRGGPGGVGLAEAERGR